MHRYASNWDKARLIYVPVENVDCNMSAFKSSPLLWGKWSLKYKINSIIHALWIATRYSRAWSLTSHLKWLRWINSESKCRKINSCDLRLNIFLLRGKTSAFSPVPKHLMYMLKKTKIKGTLYQHTVKSLNTALVVEEVSYVLALPFQHKSCQLVGIIISKQYMCYKGNKWQHSTRRLQHPPCARLFQSSFDHLHRLFYLVGCSSCMGRRSMECRFSTTGESRFAEPLLSLSLLSYPDSVLWIFQLSLRTFRFVVPFGRSLSL